jgi:glycosyltransferase involved in cell wall biosynthesis
MKIKIVGDPYSTSGYSLHCREMILAFIKAGWQVKLFHAMQDVIQHKDFSGAKLIDETLTKNFLEGDISLFITIPTHFAQPSKYNIGMFFFEADKITEEWVEMCNKMTGIIVPSEFCKKMCEYSGVTVPVIVAHGYYSQHIPSEKVDWKERLQIGVGEKTFLSVFQWNYRKGFDVLLRAFWAAFPNGGPRLVIKAYANDFRESEKEKIIRDIKQLKQMHLAINFEKQTQTLPNFPNVSLLLDRLSDDEMFWLYEQMDAFVLLTRGEGWGRPYLEAAAHEMPIIATDWSAHTEFLNKDNAYMVDATLEPCIGLNGRYYPNTSYIASPNIFQAVQHMQSINAGIHVKRPLKEVAFQFSEKRSVEEYKNAIMEICK